MSQIHPCQDNSELSPLYPSRGLHLKPIARLNVSAHYPELKQSLTTGGKSISSWDIMERIKSLVSPEIFIFLRVVKNTLEFIRFEGDLESREVLKKIITRLDGKTMKVTGFKEALKIRCAESKLIFPSKYDWDSYFRDAKNMNEMKAGERPDTIHFQNLPCKWFCEGGRPTPQDNNDKPMPSEKFFKRLWSVFGEVRCVDIPICDKYRSQISTAVRGINTFTFSNDNVFEAYVQYKDYMSFVKAMDALRGCSLFYQESAIGKYYVANIKVDFDKSKHLSDDSIRKRKTERNRLSEKDNVKKTAEKLSKFEAEVKEQKQNEREKKETEKNLAKIEYKIAMEERKYLIARRKLEAIRLMDYLFETIKTNIVTTAEKKRVLKEKTKQEMKRLEKLVIQKNTKEEQEILQANRQPKPPKVRKMQSIEKVDEEDDKDDHNTTPPKSGEPAKENQIDDSEKKVTNSGPHFDNRYLGDWELKAKSHGGSVVKVPSNYVPVSAYRGQGRGRGTYFRGRGRGISEPYSGTHTHHRDGRFENSNNYPYPNQLPPTPYNRDHRGYDYHNNRGPPFQRRSEPEQFQDGPEPTVRHDFSYLDELDRAYEKYFSSITKRHNE